MTSEDNKVRVGSIVHRPWGHYKLVEHKDDYSVKMIYIDPGEETSLQRHSKRHEMVILLDGELIITMGEHTFSKNASHRSSAYRVVAGQWHQFAVPEDQKGPTIFIEVAYGELDPDDFERQKDKYNRVRKIGPGFVSKIMDDHDWRKKSDKKS